MAGGVAAGAFGAHGLKSILSATDLVIWETAVRYQLLHGLGLLVLGLQTRAVLVTPALTMIVGTLVFSGSLFALVLLDVRWLGAITPIGGALLILSWLQVAWRLLRPVHSA